jgi:hypothetical protein
MADEAHSTGEFEKKPIRRDMQPLDFAKLERMVMLDLKTYPYAIDHRFIGKYTKDDIKTYLSAPEIFVNQIQLRYISKYLYNVSSHYKRLVQYFATMLTFDYVLEPYAIDEDNVKIDKFKKAYKKAVNLVESMNIKHEFSKIVDVAFRDDCYFGYVWMGKDSFFIQQLNPDYCRISSVEDGVYNFAFDFNYFGVYPHRLKMFPEEFQRKWNLYKNDLAERWQELDSKYAICIKINESLDYYPIPPFVGVVGNLLDIEDFKELRKTRVEMGNYKLLTQEIPIRNNSDDNNDYLITLDQVVKFHNNIANVLPEQIGLATTPMKLDILDFERDNVDLNKVAESEAEFWSAAGVSQMLFTGGKGNIAMTLSVNSDEFIGFKVLRQIERWINRFLKLWLTSSYKFRVAMLDMTWFSVDDYFDRLIQAAQYGMPVKSRLIAAMGMSPSTMQTMTFLENEVLKLHEKFIPLQSSHTQGDDPKLAGSKGGRPEMDDEDLSDEGAASKDGGKNNNKVK